MPADEDNLLNQCSQMTGSLPSTAAIGDSLSGWHGTANLPLLAAFPRGSERLRIKPTYSFEIQVNRRLHFTPDVPQRFIESGGRRLNDHGVLLALTSATISAHDHTSSLLVVEVLTVAEFAHAHSDN